MSARRAALILASLMAGAGLLGAADEAATTAAPSNSANGASSAGPSQNDEITRLKEALAAQQKQLQALQQMLQQQQQLIEKAVTPAQTSESQRPNLGNVASLTPVFPAPAPAPVASTMALPAVPAPYPQGGTTGSSANPCEAPPDAQTPAYLRLGSVCIAPIGFMDLTPFWRDKNAGSSMGSNFGSVPLNNAVNGNLSETRFSIQNSRLGLRVDGDWKGTHFIGYNEFDFNGTSGSSSLAVSNGAVVPRLRLFWVDARKGKIEFLAGQSWSMLTPNRVGISALPGNLFYSQVIDINYVAGLTWSRQPGVRILFHPNSKVTFGVSAEQPDQYMGGSAGGSTTVLPAALLGLQGLQLDAGLNLGGCANNTAVTGTAVSYSCTGQSYLAQPTVMPDIIAKLAFDPSSRFHFEVGGVVSEFKTTNVAAPFTNHYTATGGGLLFGANLGLTNNIRLITTNFWNQGEGRYLFGQAPDLVVNANGSLSALHSGGTVDGLEATIKNTLLYAYYGGDYIERDVVIDANGTSLVGYGYRGSNQNRVINEVTFGFNQTIWRSPRYGAINVMAQYEWLERSLWYHASTAPKGTHDSTIYLDVRYTLPGAIPNF
jgi:hypothetical protein